VWALVPLTLLWSITAPAHAQEQVWLKQFGSVGFDGARALANDGAGGVIIAGRTTSLLGGPIIGGKDVFLARYDATGLQLWLIKFGTTADDFADALAPDGFGGVFVAGNTKGDLDGSNAGLNDAFLAHYNDVGGLDWIRQFGTTDDDFAHALTPDGAGGVVVAGSTNGSLDGVNAGGRDVYLARYNAAGAQLWIKQFGTGATDFPDGITTDGAGGVIVAGSTDGSLGGPNAGGRDIFLARYDGAGNQLWIRQFGSTSSDNANGLATDDAGGAMVTGLTFGVIVAGAPGSGDAFLVRYDGDGNQLWARQFGSSDSDSANAIAPDGSGGVIIGGDTDGSFGGPNASFEDDVFLVGYDGLGNQTWVRQFGTEDEEDLEALAPDGAGGVFAAGTTWGDLDGTNFGRDDVFLTKILRDTDRDGLFDDWEINGIPYINGAGQDLRYLLPGANPNHKDLYVEVDLDISQVFPPASQQMVVDAFAQSPVSNPDGVSGVTLHILYDEDLIDAAFFTTFPGGHPDAGWAVEFDGLKAAHFGTPAERLVSDPAALLEAKAKAYRYCIFADKIDDGSLGTAELPGNDMFLTLGEFSSPPINTKIASTFMHEFGHTLGLGHGGGDGINGKPNYISIMNYMFTFPYNFSTSFWTLDYSRFQLPTLNESNLDETVGVNPSNISYLNFWAAHGYEKPDGGGGFTRGGILISLVPGLPIDWNTNGTNTDPSAIQDLNYMGNAAPFAGVSNPSYPQLLIGQDDWANLAYAIGTSGDFADFTHNTVPTDKPDQAMIDWINANIPLPPVVCLADTNGDSMVNVTDLLTLLGGWGPNVGHPADFNDDGNVNVTDLLTLLAAWGVCP
ncbi:MAG: SBBP repeat-containing protein, partial [Planctomycetes bacterium]|nr:SBBP repeat-containing protein [Planctomycetota bacterium]